MKLILAIVSILVVIITWSSFPLPLKEHLASASWKNPVKYCRDLCINSSLHYHSYGYPYKYSIYASFYISSPYEDGLYFESYVVTESGNYAATPGSGSLESAPRQRFL